MLMTVYIDILTPLKVLSLGFQKEVHDPVKAVKRINEFEWTMVKLKELINKCVQDDSEKLINFTRFLKECEATSDDEPHQPLTKRQKITRHQVEELEDDEDEAVSRSVQGRFEEFRESVVF
ncbi:uncharacterized protein LOC124448413 [Xenia sp. Carnegie-2017]|uniref:uncharacterized protein LOC124448413 n=1 Tax=Xenia sp. Carnegie-2017 TaxID=2897299 RepID=UPI001F047064|nr:uncharacterized protein LOC124448413 [Xenia sp. Carnegie-2017]